MVLSKNILSSRLVRSEGGEVNVYIFKAKERYHPDKEEAKRAPHSLELAYESPSASRWKFDKAFCSHIYMFSDG